MKKTLLFLTLGALLLAGCEAAKHPELAIKDDLDARMSKAVDVEITADISYLPENEQKALKKIIEASKYMDAIFLRQVSAENPAMLAALEARNDEVGKKALKFFKINVGPWDRFDEDAPFMGLQNAGYVEKPAGAGYYPADMTKEKFEAAIASNGADADALKGLFTVVERAGDGFKATPYSQAYAKLLEPAAKLLKEAAELTENESLKSFLIKRADAFFSDDYYESDIAWMELDSPVEVTIGPYEVYEDALFSYKAAFTSFVTVSDPEASKKLAVYKAELPAMEENLPIPDHMKNRNRGTESPIRVVDVVFTGGDTKAGVQTIAFNLPNDERVREEKGSKKVLLRNVITAKYDEILNPIAQRMVDASQLEFLAAEAFSNNVLFHELSHGLGPGKIKVDGRETEVRLELKDLYSAAEEAKADVMGIHNVFLIIDKGILPADMFKKTAVTYLAGLFRSVRFGANSAHGKGVAVQLNYMLEKGAISQDDEGVFTMNFDKFESVISDLTRDLCVLQANGDYAGTKALFDKYATLPQNIADRLASLDDIPIDLSPQFPLAE